MSANGEQVGGMHYFKMSIQPWEALECWLTREEFIGFLKGNIVKYIARANRKNPEDRITDLLKADHYSDKLREVLSTPEVATSEDPLGTFPLSSRIL